MKKFFGKIGNGMKKLFKGIKNGMKKLFKLITNKWLLKGTTTALLVALVIAGYVGLNWGVKQIKVADWDFTTKKMYSLSDETKERLKALENEITIQILNFKNNDYLLEYVDQYQIASDKVQVEKIEDLTTRVDLQEKYGIGIEDNVIIIKNGEKETVVLESDLYTYDYSTNETIDITEEALTNAIMEVTIKEKPHIYILEGKAYNDPEQSMGLIATQLIAEANEVELLDILTKGSVPEDCNCLIITTLKQDLSELERDKILEYINKGGKILMLTSQNKLEVETPNFDKILDQYGVTLGYGAVLEQDKSKMLYETPNMIITEASAQYLNDIDMNLKLCMINPGSIKFADETKLKELKVTYETIAKTGDSSFVRTDFNQETASRTDKDSAEGSNIVAARATKTVDNKEGKDIFSELVIFSDETFASTSQILIGYQGIFAASLYNNKDVVLNTVSSLTEREDTITIRKTSETEHYTVSDQEDVMIKTIIFVVPVLIISAGVVVWMLRRRKI